MALVEIPDFAVKSAKALSLSDALIISIYPIVMPEQRLEWEAFSMANADWVDDGVRVQNRSKFYYGPIITDYENKGIIHNDWYDIPRNETRIMLPLWQNSPVIPRWPAFNWDLGSAVTCLNGEGCAAFEAIESHKTKLSEAYNLPDMSVPEEVEETEGFVDWFSDFVPPGDDPAEPVSDIVVPIINNIDYVELEDADSPDHQAVGVTVRERAPSCFGHDRLVSLICLCRRQSSTGVTLSAKFCRQDPTALCSSLRIHATRRSPTVLMDQRSPI